MCAVPVQELSESRLPFEHIEKRAVALGLQKRKRSFDPACMVLALVLNGGTAESRRLAAALREYVRRGGREVVRGAFYKWFDEELLALMEELATRARDYVLAMPVSHDLVRRCHQHDVRFVIRLKGGYIQWAGKDPNLRSRPSPIDDAKGRNPAGRAMWRHRAKRVQRQRRLK